jgi:hypothetical protein
MATISLAHHGAPRKRIRYDMLLPFCGALVARR